MAIKQKDFMDFLGIPNEEYDPTKNRLVILFEEADNEEEFVVQIFDISENETKISLIKELGYGILSHLYDEDFVNAIREAGRYSFNAKYPQSSEEKINYTDTIIEFKKLH